MQADDEAAVSILIGEVEREAKNFRDKLKSIESLSDRSLKRATTRYYNDSAVTTWAAVFDLTLGTTSSVTSDGRVIVTVGRSSYTLREFYHQHGFKRYGRRYAEQSLKDLKGAIVSETGALRAAYTHHSSR